jgi:hypothetical protein
MAGPSRETGGIRSGHAPEIVRRRSRSSREAVGIQSGLSPEVVRLPSVFGALFSCNIHHSALPASGRRSLVSLATIGDLSHLSGPGDCKTPADIPGSSVNHRPLNPGHIPVQRQTCRSSLRPCQVFPGAANIDRWRPWRRLHRHGKAPTSRSCGLFCFRQRHTDAETTSFAYLCRACHQRG